MIDKNLFYQDIICKSSKTKHSSVQKKLFQICASLLFITAISQKYLFADLIIFKNHVLVENATIASQDEDITVLIWHDQQFSIYTDQIEKVINENDLRNNPSMKDNYKYAAEYSRPSTPEELRDSFSTGAQSLPKKADPITEPKKEKNKKYLPETKDLSISDLGNLSQVYFANKKDPYMAMFWAFVLPSAGHAYAGDWGRGLNFFALRAASVVVMYAGYEQKQDMAYGFGAAAFVILALWEPFDAMVTAEGYNHELRKDLKINAEPTATGMKIKLEYSY